MLPPASTHRTLTCLTNWKTVSEGGISALRRRPGRHRAVTSTERRLLLPPVLIKYRWPSRLLKQFRLPRGKDRCPNITACFAITSMETSLLTYICVISINGHCFQRQKSSNHAVLRWSCSVHSPLLNLHTVEFSKWEFFFFFFASKTKASFKFIQEENYRHRKTYSSLGRKIKLHTFF
jgi:hypothetical protein